MIRIDNNNLAFKLYHLSNKGIIPLSSLSYVNWKYQLHCDKIFYPISTILLGYHSFFSVENIINDYIKFKNLNKLTRLINVKSHLIASYGFLNYIYQHNKEI